MFKEFDEFSFNDIFEAKPKYKKLKLKEGERRQVSILFADLSGFTALSETLDSEEVQTIVDEILTIFTKCIEHFGGNIDKYEGDLVMAHFGAIKASERDTERAISSGLLMLKQLHIFNKKLQNNSKTKDVKFNVRIGINTGEVTTGKVGKKRQYDFTVYGPAVNLASRMESNAPLNQIMIPDGTRELVKDSFEFENFGEISVKGISKPISVFLVKKRKDERIQRWEFQQSKLVGRQEELQTLRNTFEEVQQRSTENVNDKPILIGINGEPGIGKSRLVYELIQDSSDFVLFGSTPKIFQTHFALFTSMLSKYFKILRSDSMTEKRDKFEKGLKKLESLLSDENDIIELRDCKPLIGLLFHIEYNDSRLKLDGKELLTHIQIAIRHFIEAVAGGAQNSNSSLIVVFEDLHWLDDISANTINFLIETLNLEEKRNKKLMKNIFFILIYRPEYDLPAILKSKTEFTEIELLPLDTDNSNQIIRSMIPEHTIHESVIKKVMDMSLGNPFYLEEWCNFVNDLGEKIHSSKLPIPNSLNALISARIDKLDKDMKQMLQKAAVIGKEFLTKILTEVENRLETAMNVSEFLDELETNEYLRRILGVKYSKYFFKHILTHEVAYRTILRSNRRLLHKLVAEIIEEQFAENLIEYYFELAHHYSIAEVNEKAIEYLEKAGDLAKKNFDNYKAIELYDKLISLSDDPDKTKTLNIKIQLKKVEILILIGKFNTALELVTDLLSRSKKNNYKKYISLALQFLSHIHLIRNNSDTAFELLSKRMKMAKEENDLQGEIAVTGNFGIFYLIQTKFEEALPYLLECLAMSEKVNDTQQIVKSHTNLGLVYLELFDFENSIKHSKKSYRLANENGFKESELTAIVNLGMVYKLQGNVQEALKCFEASLHIAEEIQNKQKIALALGNIGNVFRETKNYEKAIEYYKKTYKVKEEMGLKRGLAITCCTIAQIYEYQKKYEKAIKLYTKGIELSENWKIDQCTYLLQKAEILFILKNYNEAQIVTSEMLKLSEQNNLEILLFKAKMLKEKISCKKNNKNFVQILMVALCKTKNTEVTKKKIKLAHIYFEIWYALRYEENKNESEKYRIIALQLYTKLYSKTPLYEFKKKIDELKEI